MILKYGITIDVPNLSELEYEGVKKPDFLLTVGSGWLKYGKKNVLKLNIFNQEFLY